MYYKRPVKGVFSGQIVARSGIPLFFQEAAVPVFRPIASSIRVIRVIRGKNIFALGSCGQRCPRSDENDDQFTNSVFKDRTENTFRPDGEFRSKSDDQE